MTKLILDMSMSLDGFIAGPDVRVDNGLGDGGERLHEWIFAGAPSNHGGLPALPSGANGKIINEYMSTGAVVAGRGTFEPARGWGGDHHEGAPIFILSRRGPIEGLEFPLVTYTDDVAAAINGAKDAAGGKDVLVHGATVAQLALGAGLLDELEVHVVPVLLGQGRRLFDNLDPEQIELERIRILEGEGGVTHMRYRVT